MDLAKTNGTLPYHKQISSCKLLLVSEGDFVLSASQNNVDVLCFLQRDKRIVTLTGCQGTAHYKEVIQSIPNGDCKLETKLLLLHAG